MESVSPWLICVGAMCIWPGLLFGLGFYIGRRGLPFSISWRGGSPHDGYSE